MYHILEIRDCATTWYNVDSTFLSERLKLIATPRGGTLSVKLIDNDAFYGYRVRRTVDGKLYQEYLSLKKAGKRMGPTQQKRVERIANKRDAELEEAQRKAKDSRKAERCFHTDGTVKGISFLKKKEKSGNLTPIFQVGIASEIENKIVCTSFSVNAHGLEGAWFKAVEAYTHHKSIRKNTKLYRQIKAAMPEVDLSDVEAAAKKVAERKAKAASTRKKATTKAATKAKPKAKTAAKKVVKKPVAKKAAPKKAAVKAKTAVAKKKPAAKKVTAKKAVAKKKPAAKKATARKPAAKAKVKVKAASRAPKTAVKRKPAAKTARKTTSKRKK
ncbi:Uncharacterised protein [BD1-7 clade bacterium]|uniref:Uncharacterized protein n=1 Tax=BD1-7 clade bacterium TaxID=2029982 RepID=A0A5S9QSU7_9GAMM|nr:Uncharacterised protein [BD1-7 clade bacterium]CAA0121325.1 Uncharacterised protein [BD1-7 clade bacterium]